tara:strand:- start:709 stop:912 length:204 start_codon:yes stop_codon:yes gene_type:complete
VGEDTVLQDSVEFVEEGEGEVLDEGGDWNGQENETEGSASPWVASANRHEHEMSMGGDSLAVDDLDD